MQMLGVRGMGLGAALTFGAVLWLATRGTEPVAEGSARLRELAASHASVLSASTSVAPAVRDEPAGPLLHATADVPPSVAEASFETYVHDKYRYLLEMVDSAPHETQAVRAALLKRERLVVDINTARQASDQAARAALPARLEQLATLDGRIRRILPASALAAFEYLRDSHIEQFQLDDYAGGIRDVAPLPDADRRAVLFSKMAYRIRFREVLDQSGLMRDDLTPAQRQAALPMVVRALREARDGFLQEARQHLTDEQQYALLANYENSEYRAELEKLRGIGGS
jgi:hypothetical protein